MSFDVPTASTVYRPLLPSEGSVVKQVFCTRVTEVPVGVQRNLDSPIVADRFDSGDRDLRGHVPLYSIRGPDSGPENHSVLHAKVCDPKIASGRPESRFRRHVHELATWMIPLSRRARRRGRSATSF